MEGNDTEPNPSSKTPDEETWGDAPSEIRGLPKSTVDSSLSKFSDTLSKGDWQVFAENVNSQHLDKWLEIEEKKQNFIDKENERQLQAKKIEQDTVRYVSRNVILGVLGIFIVIFTYAGLTKDTRLPEKIANIGIGAIGGIAGVITYNRFSKKS